MATLWMAATRKAFALVLSAKRKGNEFATGNATACQLSQCFTPSQSYNNHSLSMAFAAYYPLDNKIEVMSAQATMAEIPFIIEAATTQLMNPSTVLLR